MERRRSFDALRLIAALAVLISHSFAITGHPEPRIGSLTLGTVAVYVFFGISGYLITQSWYLDPSLPRFVAKRALRIYPALLVVVVFLVLIVGPVSTTLPLTTYLRSGETWRLALLDGLNVHPVYTLPGVFAHNPLPLAVDGSLWTLPAEMLAYALVAAVGMIGFIRRGWPAFLAVLVLAVLTQRLATNIVDVEYCLQAFAVGLGLYVARDRIPLRGWAAGLLVVAVVLVPDRFQSWAAIVAVPYGAIYTAQRFPALLQNITGRGDFSYGIYLYAFPVSQMVVWLWRPGPWVTVLVGIPVTTFLAAASWLLVERRALALKRRLGHPAALGLPAVRIAEAAAITGAAQ